VAALLCMAYERAGKDVIALDGDSNPNLAHYLGVDSPEKIVPLAEMEELVRERTGARKGAYGMYFKMNPRVDDFPERFCTRVGRIRLLTMGAVSRGGGGCACPEYVLLKNLVAHLLLNRNETLVMDMEAGLEHLGRGVTESVDVLLVVLNPDRVSILTGDRIKRLAGDIGVKRIVGVANRVESKGEEEYIRAHTSLEVVGSLPFSRRLVSAFTDGGALDVESVAEPLRDLMRGIGGGVS